MSDGRGEPELVLAAKGGDCDAFGRLVTLHQRMITRLALRMLADLDEADAAAQDAFVKAWEKIGEFRGDCPFGAWVARIVVNVCRDRLRRGKLVVAESRLERRGDDDDGGPLSTAVDGRPDPESALLAREAGRKIAELASRLPAKQREVFSLRYYEDRPLAEIAALFGVDVGTVKTHLFRATHRMRRSLEELYGNRLPF
jgi:RNA polymerase sigma-70 factor (ECF subfamily)